LGVLTATFKKGHVDRSDDEELRREAERLIKKGYLLDIDGKLYSTLLGDFEAEYIEKVESGLIEPGPRTWESMFIRFVKEKSNDYIILKHRSPLASFEKWL
jgi:hypothetical protein